MTAPAGMVAGDASRPRTSIAGSAPLILNFSPETLIMVLTLAMITMGGTIYCSGDTQCTGVVFLTFRCAPKGIRAEQDRAFVADLPARRVGRCPTVNYRFAKALMKSDAGARCARVPGTQTFSRLDAPILEPDFL